jgi:hypothetical protein
VFPLLAADRPDLFNAYQQTQGRKVEKAMTKAGYVASFIGHEPGKALFVGLYKIGKIKTSYSRAILASSGLRRIEEVGNERLPCTKPIFFAFGST